MLKRILKSLRNVIQKVFLSKSFFYVLFVISLILLFLYNYIFQNFSNITLEQLLYSLKTSKGTDLTVVLNGFIYIFARILIIFILLMALLVFCHKKMKTRVIARITIRNKSFEFSLYPFTIFFINVVVFIFFIGTLIFLFIKLDLFSYFQDNTSTFIEDNYVDASKVSITAPEEKQNLVYIFVESLESSFVTVDNGGAFKRKVIPNLEKMALENINFSQTDKIGGGAAPYGTHWTIAGMVSQTAGVPLKLPLRDSNTYFGYNSFLPGVYSLGDVLKDNGYKNYLMLGSPSYFGGRADYFKLHGDYEIYDYDYAKDKKWIENDYNVWWGFEDKKLFNFAKKELTRISENDKPFNFTLLTADTHFTGGYVDETCDEVFAEHYLNSYHCSDSEIADFINWLKEQDFYKNTTVIITGDHFTMQRDILDMYDIDNPENYQRSVYNVFFNSKTEAETYKNRNFNSFDIYPTTLAALGFTIEGDKLGLGTNLFSSKKTLTEINGYNYINKEIQKNSEFYNEKLLGSSYKDMLLDKTKANE